MCDASVSVARFLFKQRGLSLKRTVLKRICLKNKKITLRSYRWVRTFTTEWHQVTVINVTSVETA